MLDRSGNTEVTRRRRMMVVASGLSFAAALVAVSLVKGSWQVTLGIALLYIGITVVERVAYANTVLVYKGLIRKLKAGMEERESSQPQD
jgi:hypothetical protein